MTSLRDLPSVEQLLQNSNQLLQEYGRPLTLEALRLTLDEARARFKAGSDLALPSTEVIVSQAGSHLAAWTASSLLPVINATGVILHTNLGRAPLSRETIQAMKEVDDRQYSACERHQYQNEKSPARPDVRKCIIDKEIESTPAKYHERERCETEWFKSELFIH